MKKKLFSRVVSAITAGFVALTSNPMLEGYSEKNDDGTIPLTDDKRNELLGVSDKEEYFLGAASQFSVFLEGDFSANGSDCEGRLAAGGNANMGDPVSYSVGIV